MAEIDDLIKLLLDEPNVRNCRESEAYAELEVLPDFTPEELEAMNQMPFVEYGDPLDEVYDDSTDDDEDSQEYSWCGVKDGQLK